MRTDAALAAAVLTLQCVLASVLPESEGHRPGILGWLLLVASAVALIERRRSPMLVTVAVVLLVGPYHAMDNVHLAVVPAGMVAVFTLAVTGPPLRAYLTVGTVIGIMVTIMATGETPHAGVDMLRSSGWVLAVVVLGDAVRIHRRYIAAIVERAERAERTREEEAARRVAEERLRIARDLHDLLAHSITLIGVQTSVAAHVLIADPERLDRAALATALDGIADTCRDARAELRTTLRVLRADDAPGGDGRDPLPHLDGLPDLANTARAAGAEVDLAVLPGDREPAPVPAAVGAAAYRIVQESLTNAVRHGGPDVRIRVRVERTRPPGALRVTVIDTGPGRAPAEPPTGGAVTGGAAEPPTGGVGFGIAGMRERARSVGGTLDAGSHETGGFQVTALLPLDAGSHHEEKP
ncbi:sensor histidine kinase [Streptomyces sp. XD-27]|uniref:sensor histidine kinase n=1 Tax=Streptomyces sp. XD-27 TaxID=3062779 RepID=UPI0026F4624F|nr:ATP-binding protein [Streptomyces sp. XD-27]WKX74204.1 histidine kinase [Streptomyces sp. XD-27]